MRHLGFLLALLAAPVAAQQTPATSPTQTARPLNLQPALKPPVADTGIFSPLPLPPASDIRSADGAPGARYWQQRADYTIKATLDTAEKRLSATEQIRYTNNSPDTLRFVWMQVDQNLFRPGSIGSLLFAAESRFGGAGFPGGFEIASLTQTAPASAPGRPQEAEAPAGARVDAGQVPGGRHDDVRRAGATAGAGGDDAVRRSPISSTFRSTAPTAWAATGVSTKSPSGTPAWRCTTTSTAGTPTSTWARASSTSSTATSTTR